MSPSTERVSAKTDTATEIRPGTATATGRAPSRAQRHSRSNAVAPSSADDRVERGDDDIDIDPYPDIPEELEPDDPDHLDPWWSLDETRRRRLAGPQHLLLNIRRLGPPPGSPGRRQVRASPSPTPSVPGLRIRITRNQGAGADLDDVAAADADHDLAAIASAVGHGQYQAVVAGSQAEAFDALTPMNQKRLAEESGLGEYSISRRRRVIIECPWGLAPSRSSAGRNLGQR